MNNIKKLFLVIFLVFFSACSESVSEQVNNKTANHPTSLVELKDETIKSDEEEITNPISGIEDFTLNQFVYPELGVQVGQGWNSIDEIPSTDICIEFSEIEEIGHEVRTIFHDIQNRHHLNQILKVSTAAKTKISGVSASASAKFASEVDLSSSSRNLMVQVLVDNGDTYAGPKALNPDIKMSTSIKLKDEYLKLLSEEICDSETCLKSGRQKFLKACGDSFVAKIDRGGELFVNYKMKEMNKKEETSFALKLKASGYGSKGTLRINTSNNLEISENVEDFSVYQRGGPKLPIPVNLDSIFSSVQSFVIGQGNEKFTPRPYTISTTGYESLPGVNEISLPSAATMDNLVSINALYSDLLKTYRNIEANALPDDTDDLSLFNNPDEKNDPYLVLSAPSYYISAETSKNSARDQVETITRTLSDENKQDIENKLISQLMVVGFLEHLSFRAGYDFDKFKLNKLKIDPKRYIFNDTHPSTVAGKRLFLYQDIEETLSELNKGLDDVKSTCGVTADYSWQFDNSPVDINDNSIKWNIGSLEMLENVFYKALDDDIILNKLEWAGAVYKGKGHTDVRFHTSEIISVPVSHKEEPFHLENRSDEKKPSLKPNHFKEIECWQAISSNTWAPQNIRNIIYEIEIIQLLIHKSLKHCFRNKEIVDRTCKPNNAIFATKTELDGQTYDLDLALFRDVGAKLFYKNNFENKTDKKVSAALQLLTEVDGHASSIGVDTIRENLFNELVNSFLGEKSLEGKKDFTTLASKLYYHYFMSIPLQVSILKEGETDLNNLDNNGTVEATRLSMIRYKIAPDIYKQSDYFCGLSKSNSLCLSSTEVQKLVDSFKFRIPVKYHDIYKTKKYCKVFHTYLPKVCYKKRYHSNRRIAFDILRGSN